MSHLPESFLYTFASTPPYKSGGPSTQRRRGRTLLGLSHRAGFLLTLSQRRQWFSDLLDKDRTRHWCRQVNGVLLRHAAQQIFFNCSYVFLFCFFLFANSIEKYIIISEEQQQVGVKTKSVFCIVYACIILMAIVYLFYALVGHSTPFYWLSIPGTIATVFKARRTRNVLRAARLPRSMPIVT